MSTLATAEAHYLAGRLEQAEALLRRHLQRVPRDAAAAFCLGNILRERGQTDQAIYFFRACVSANDAARWEYFEALSRALLEGRKRDEALSAARRSVELARLQTQDGRGAAAAHVQLGATLLESGQVEAARDEFRYAIALEPGLAAPRVYLADSYLMAGDPDRAALHAEETVLATTGDANHFLNCATAAVFTLYASHDLRAGGGEGAGAGQSATSSESSEGAARSTPANANTDGAPLMSPDEIFRRHGRVARVLAGMPPPDPPVIVRDRAPERPLRVAFMSPDFIQHSCSYFFEMLLDHLDKRAIVPIGFSASHVSDHVTARLRAKCLALAGAWHQLRSPTDSMIHKLLDRERIDVAMDMAGYTVSSVLWPLRVRAVPLQATWLGYPCTTALPTMDARLVDALTDPPSTPERPHEGDARYSERLVRLPGCFICYRPPDEATVPAVAPAPMLRIGAEGSAVSAEGAAGAPTFGSFNLLGKLSRRTRDLWARVLHALPSARLILKDSAFEHEQVRESVRREFAQRGIAGERLELLPKAASRDEHLALYARVDVALDPLPYNGTTTTCEAMFMGLPVVTLAGPAGLHHARVGASLLGHVGLGELVAQSEEQYVSIAQGLVNPANAERLRTLRAGMRRRLVSSPVCDGPGFARGYEGALRTLWREYLARG